MKSRDERSAKASDGDPARDRISGGGEMGKEWRFKITFTCHCLNSGSAQGPRAVKSHVPQVPEQSDMGGGCRIEIIISVDIRSR